MSNIRFTSFSRDVISGEVVGVARDDFMSYPLSEWNSDEMKAATAECGMNPSQIDTEHVYKIDPDAWEKGDGGKSGGDRDENDSDGEKSDDNKCEDCGEDSHPGTGCPEPEDGDGDGEESESEQDGDGDQDGEQDGDQDGDGEQGESDKEMDEYPEPDADMSIPENPLADDLWPYIEPNVRAHVQAGAEHSARFAIDLLRREISAGNYGKGDGKGGITIRVSGKKSGKVEGLVHYQFDKVLRLLARGVHIYLFGPPGTGKSHLGIQAAEALGLPIAVQSFSQMSTESKLMGYNDANGNYVGTSYFRAFTQGEVWMGDELDNSNPGIITGMNSGLANGMVDFPCGTHKMHENFICIATANTHGTGPTAEFSGRVKLDPATLDRFVFVPVGTDEVMETALVENIIGSTQGDRWLSKVRHVRRACEALGIKHFVTMRGALNGAKMIAPGDGKFTIPEALEMTSVLGPLNDDQRAKIKAWKG